MDPALQLVVFCVEGQRHALPLATVERVIHAVEVTPLPGAPAAVLGAMDLAGRIVPVFSLRRRIGLPDRPLRPADHFVIARAGARTVGLAVDEVQAVSATDAAVAEAASVLPGLESVHGVVRLDDGLLLIHDLGRFLSADEERALDAAVSLSA